MKTFRSPLALLAALCTLALPACDDEDQGDGVFTGSDPGTHSETPPAEASEVVAGGGRVKGGNVVMDVQIGHGASQRQSASDTQAVEGNTVVKE